MVRELYAVEEQAKEVDNTARRELRQAQSVPVLERIKAWLDAEQEIVLPRSEMGKAFTYALNQWDALCAYTAEGFLAIDNNAAERAMKRVAIGRKNWLFAGNDKAGETAALLYSLIASAERHAIDPQRYLTSVLAKLPFTPRARIRAVPAGRVEEGRRGGTTSPQHRNLAAVVVNAEHVRAVHNDSLNNAAERAMKRVAIGRKNWLFAGNDEAGQTAAILWSLIASAERHGVDPQRYLTSVLAKLPFTPEGEMDQFLPDVWKQEDNRSPN